MVGPGPHPQLAGFTRSERSAVGDDPGVPAVAGHTHGAGGLRQTPRRPRPARCRLGLAPRLGDVELEAILDLPPPADGRGGAQDAPHRVLAVGRVGPSPGQRRQDGSDEREHDSVGSPDAGPEGEDVEAAVDGDVAAPVESGEKRALARDVEQREAAVQPLPRLDGQTFRAVAVAPQRLAVTAPQHALGDTGRARGVHQLRRRTRVVVQGAGSTPRCRLDEVVDAWRPTRAGRASEDEHVTQVGEAVPDRLDVGEQVGRDDQDVGPAVPHHLTERLPGEQHVQGQVDGAELGARQPGGEKTPAVGGPDHHDVAAAVAVTGEHLGHAVGEVVRLRVGESRVGKGDQGPRTQRRRPGFQQGPDRLVAACGSGVKGIGHLHGGINRRHDIPGPPDPVRPEASVRVETWSRA